MRPHFSLFLRLSFTDILFTGKAPLVGLAISRPILLTSTKISLSGTFVHINLKKLAYFEANLVELIKKTIHSNYRLNREKRDWLLDHNVKLRSPDRHSFGFSLDEPYNPPFAFLSGDPPAHISRMCDAIVVVSHDQKSYIFLIEQKTAHKGAYGRQLINGKLFCEWLGRLYRTHKYGVNDLVFVGLLLWRPHKASDKETMRPRARPERHELFDHFFNIRNKKHIYLLDLIRQL